MKLPDNILAGFDAIVERQIKMPIGCCRLTRKKVEAARAELKKKMIEKYKQTVNAQ